jgi:transposase
MPYINRVKKKGKYYLYLVHDARVDGKKVHVYQKYLGPEDRINELGISELIKKHVDNLEFETLSFGISAALWQIVDEIDLIGIIDKCTGKSRQQGLTLGEYLAIAAINRCAAPCSKSKLGRWFERDWLGSRFSIEPTSLNSQTYWNHFQYLDMVKIREIEREIIEKVVTKYDIGVDTVLYDPTNFFTFSRGGRGWKDGDGSELLMFGNSKENRNGNRLVAFWLLCERDSGVPIMHETYAGNRQDAGVFNGLESGEQDGGEKISVPVQVARRLEVLGCDLKKVTMVFDNGNLSPDGMKAIEDAGIGFIASRRPSTHKDLLHVPIDDFTETVLPATGKTIKYYHAIETIYGKKRTVYVSFDPAKHEKDVIKFNAKLDQKLLEIKEYFKDRASFNPGEKKGGQGDKWRARAQVEKKIKSMVGRRPFKDIITWKVEGPSTIDVGKGGRFTITLDVDADARAKHEETLGRAVVFTNRETWSPEAVIWGHREQYVVEHAFRQMKCPDTIALRPMYHHADPCIRAHVFTCVLGHLLLSLLRLKLKKKHIPATYTSIINILRDIKIIKIIPSPGSKGFMKLNKLGSMATKLSRILDLESLVAS